MTPLLDAALILVLAAHLVLVDVAMAGPLVCVWLDRRRAKCGDSLVAQVGYLVARDAVWSLLLGTGLGFVLCGLWWWSPDETFAAAVRALPASRWWFALAELIFSLACLACYVVMWTRGPARRLWRSLLAIVGATNLAYHFPLLFAVISVVRTRPGLVGTTLDRDTLRHLLFDPEVLSRAIHVWLASAAVAGVLVMLRSARIGRRATDRAGALQLTAWGARLALVATLLQMPIGVWVLLQMPERGRAALCGGNVGATLVFCLAIVAALRLMHLLAEIAMGGAAVQPTESGATAPVETDLGHAAAREVRGVAAMMVAVIVFMSAALHLAQRQSQSPATKALAGSTWRVPE